MCVCGGGGGGGRLCWKVELIMRHVQRDTLCSQLPRCVVVVVCVCGGVCVEEEGGCVGR